MRELFPFSSPVDTFSMSFEASPVEVRVAFCAEDRVDCRRRVGSCRLCCSNDSQEGEEPLLHSATCSWYRPYDRDTLPRELDLLVCPGLVPKGILRVNQARPQVSDADDPSPGPPTLRASTRGVAGR